MISNEDGLAKGAIGMALFSKRDRRDLSGVRPEFFSDPVDGEIWKIIQHLDAEGEGVSLALVLKNSHLADEQTRAQITAARLADALHAAPPGHLGRAYAKQLRDTHHRHKMASALTQGQQLLRGGAATKEVKLHVLESLSDLTDDVESSVQMDIAVDEAVRRLSESTPSVPTPWGGINRAITGWRPGALYVIGARPGVGKSLFLQQSALDLATHGQVVFATMEMTAAEVSNRFLSMRTGIAQGKLSGLHEDGTSPLSPREWAEIDAAAAKLRGLPIRFEEHVQTPTDIRERARELAANGPLAAIFVDYLQLLGTPDNARYRIQELTRYTRELKRMASEFRCPVIVAAQMNRNSASLGRPPNSSEFRESGSVEQDADVAIILHENAAQKMRDQESQPGTPLDAYIAKNRQGPSRAVLLRKHGSTATIRDDVGRIKPL